MDAGSGSEGVASRMLRATSASCSGQARSSILHLLWFQEDRASRKPVPINSSMETTTKGIGIQSA